LVTTAPAGSLSQFDDSGLSPSDLLYPRPVTEAHVIHSSLAAYDASALHLKQPTTSVVSVLVGVGGEIVAAKISQSSGYATLDAAAVAAARKIEFSAPLFNGAPIPLEYLVTYRFAPR